MSTQSQMVADYKAERDELEDRCIRLASLNRELEQFIEGCANVFALQAFRDQSAPDTLAGWVKLKEQARALLAKAKESA